MYRTLFCVAYYGMFRISELASGDHPVRVSDVHVADNKAKWLFVLRSSKTHGPYSRPQTISITKQLLNKKTALNGKININQPTCPYELLLKYLKARPKYEYKTEPLFVFRDYSPVTTDQACRVLKKVLVHENFNHALYRLHSFRIGRSINLFKLGISVSVIRKLGRWKLSTVYTYLK